MYFIESTTYIIKFIHIVLILVEPQEQYINGKQKLSDVIRVREMQTDFERTLVFRKESGRLFIFLFLVYDRTHSTHNMTIMLSEKQPFS